MRLCLSFSIFVFGALGVTGCGSKPTAPAEDHAKEFLGIWETVPPTKREHATTFKFEDSTFFFVEQGDGPSGDGGKTNIGFAGPGGPKPRGEKGTFNVNAAADPKAIDLVIADGIHQGKLRLGIYAFDGDKLKICLADYAAMRPTEFTPENKCLLLVMKRKAAPVAAPAPTLAPKS